jgi:hypothetical protein
MVDFRACVTAYTLDLRVYMRGTCPIFQLVEAQKDSLVLNIQLLKAYPTVQQSFTMVAIKNILLFITAASALAIVKRDAATILTDISTISTNVAALTKAVTNYQGGILGALPILSAEQTLETSVSGLNLHKFSDRELVTTCETY